MKKCTCGGILDYLYHVIWKCRDCGRWDCEEQAVIVSSPVPFLSREVVKPRPHAHGSKEKR